LAPFADKRSIKKDEQQRSSRGQAADYFNMWVDVRQFTERFLFVREREREREKSLKSPLCGGVSAMLL
jgi:hypothetical protein